MMHLMNSRFTTMARSRHRIAGGELAGKASSSRRSRACVCPQYHTLRLSTIIGHLSRDRVEKGR